MQTLARPSWLNKKVRLNQDFEFTKGILDSVNVNTVCRFARCPNIFDCFSRKIAAFLILGNICTRDCGFCAVQKGVPGPPDVDEPNRVARAAFLLGIKHIVITSVTRDDLIDGGSSHFAAAIKAVKNRFSGSGDAVIEVLAPDFKMNEKAIREVVFAGPDIFGHNIETVPRLYRRIRPQADYERSLGVLRIAKEIMPGLVTKSAIMLGLGESADEVISVMTDLRKAGCDIIAIGQYLRPSPAQVEVADYVSPSQFSEFEKIGRSLGFKSVQSGPFVRSSYREVKYD